MTLNDFERRWLDVRAVDGKNTVKRVDSKHSLDVFVGYDILGRQLFLLISNINPNISIYSKSISVETTQRDDGKYAACFTLMERLQEPAFLRLCWDLFDFSNTAESESEGILMIQQRFRVWQKLLQKGSDGLLTDNVIKGLIGELLFLETYCFPKYGLETSIDAWIGTQNADKDFVFNDIWYEIKALDTSALEVSISSLEQLDSLIDGRLVLVYLNKTSHEDDNRISLYMKVENIKKILSDVPILTMKFENKLAHIGYQHRLEYDNPNFFLSSIEHYDVNDTFPKIIKNDIASAVSSVKYQLDIASLENWRIKDEY